MAQRRTTGRGCDKDLRYGSGSNAKGAEAGRWYWVLDRPVEWWRPLGLIVEPVSSLSLKQPDSKES